MNRVVRRKLAMAKRVRDFCRAHPVDTLGFREVMEELERRLGRVEELVAHRLGSAHREDGSLSTRMEVRTTIREKYLRNLVRIARGAADEDLLLSGKFILPSKRIGGLAFLARANVLVDEAERRHDLFIRDGIPSGFIAEARSLLAQFAQMLESEESDQLRSRREIRDLTVGMPRLLKRLDGINMLRFQEDAETLQAWSAIRNAAADSAPGPEDGLDPAA